MSNETEQQPSPPQSTPPTEAEPAAPAAAPAESLLSTPPAEEATAEAPEPVTAEDLALPEGFNAEPETLQAFVEAINGDLPPKERAEALLGLHTQLLEQTAKQLEDNWTQMRTEWKDAVRALPEIGGSNLDQTLGEIAKVVDRYGGKEAREAFALTGAGDHPAIIQLFAKIAKDLNEAPPVSGAPPTGAPKSRAERLFGATE